MKNEAELCEGKLNLSDRVGALCVQGRREMKSETELREEKLDLSA